MQKRRVFQIIGNEEREIDFSQIKKGMRIKMYDDDKIVKFKNNDIMIAKSDAYKNKNNIYTIDV